MFDRKLAALSVTCVIGLVAPNLSVAYSFVPTDFDWAAWPHYCKARYVTTFAGEASKFRNALSRPEIEAGRQQIGQATFEHVHHYCAGRAYLSQAKLATNQQQRSELLAQATAEATYTFNRIPESSPLYPTIAVTLGDIFMELKRPEEAIRYIEQGRAANPRDPRSYLGLAMAYRELKRPEQALEALLQGDKLLDGQSIEIHYHLGLLYLDLGQPQLAMEYARKAYSRDYPLPGLKDRLRRAGAWTE